jgi:predicted nucleic acid-binding protein
MARFLDTNILIRYLTNDDPDKAAAALDLLDRLAEGSEQVVTTPLVIFETVFLLERSYKAAKADVREKVAGLLALQGLQLAEGVVPASAGHLCGAENLLRRCLPCRVDAGRGSRRGVQLGSGF